MSEEHPELTSGVYYGVVALDPQNLTQENGAEKSTSATILPAVLSIGYNPFYKNTVRSVVCVSAWFTLDFHDSNVLDACSHYTPQEIHIMPPLSQPSPTAVAQPKFNRLPDFYGTQLNLLILGYIRPEYDYVSLEALVEDIRIDCEVARQSLLRETYQRYIVDDGKAPAEVNEDRKWLATF